MTRPARLSKVALLGVLLVAPPLIAPVALAGETSASFRGVAQAAVVGAPDRPRGADAWNGYLGYGLTGEAEYVTDTGLTIGLTATVGSGDYEKSLDRPGSNEEVTLNELFVSVTSAWGRIRIGDEDGAAKRAVDLLPLLAGGQMDGWWTRVSSAAPAVDPLGRDSDDATKLLYETPRVAGLRLGVSYAPERRSLVEDIARPSAIAPEKEFWEVGANYKMDVAALSLELAAGYGAGRAGRARHADSSTVTLGALALYGGFSLGTVWSDGEAGVRPGDATGLSSVTVQGAYENGPYAIALFANDATATRLRRTFAYGLGLSSRIGRENSVALDVSRYGDDPDGPRPTARGTAIQLQLETRF